MEYSGESRPERVVGPATGPERKTVSRGLFIAVSILALCTFLGLVVAAAAAVVSTVSLAAANKQLTERVNKLESNVEYLDDETTRFWIASDMYTSGVTDSFYTNNVLFCSNNVVTMDISVQGPADSIYAGEGKFAINDIDLKAKIYEMMLEFKKSYDNAKGDSMANFSKLEVRITVNGYQLATYKDDKVTLVNR